MCSCPLLGAETRGVPTGAVVSPVVAQRQIPMVSLTMEIIQLQLIDRVFDVVHVSRLQAWRRQSSSTVLTWRRRSRSHSAVLRSWTWLLTCPLRCVYRCLSWSRQCRKGGVGRCSSWTGYTCPQRQVPDGPDSAENCGVSAVGADFRTRLSTCPCWTSRGLIFLEPCAQAHGQG